MAWSQYLYLPLSMLAYRPSTNNITGLTPSLLMLGKEVELLGDLLSGRHDTPSLPVENFFKKLQ